MPIKLHYNQLIFKRVIKRQTDRQETTFSDKVMFVKEAVST